MERVLKETHAHGPSQKPGSIAPFPPQQTQPVAHIFFFFSFSLSLCLSSLCVAGCPKKERLERGSPCWLLKLRWTGLKGTTKRCPFLVGSLGLSCQHKRFFLLCLGCSGRPSTKYFFLTTHFFNVIFSVRSTKGPWMWVTFSTNVSLTCDVVESNAPIVINNFSYSVHIGCAEVEHNICTGNTENNIYSHFVQKLGRRCLPLVLITSHFSQQTRNQRKIPRWFDIHFQILWRISF